jgi:hypothetical protein
MRKLSAQTPLILYEVGTLKKAFFIVTRPILIQIAAITMATLNLILENCLTHWLL